MRPPEIKAPDTRGEGAAIASTVTYLLPVVAIVLGVLVLGESITVAALAGIALVLAGVALTGRRTKPAWLAKEVELVIRQQIRDTCPPADVRQV
jgi:EamA-like transporter family